MTNQQEKNHQILTQPPETIYSASDEFDRPALTNIDATVEPTEKPTEITAVDGLITTPLKTEDRDEIDNLEKKLTSESEDNPADNSPHAHNLITENPDIRSSVISIATPAEITESADDSTPAPPAIYAEITPSEEQQTTAAAETPAEINRSENYSPPALAENSPETTHREPEITVIQSPATTVRETGIIVVETPPEIPPEDIRKFFPEAVTENDRIETDLLAAGRDVNPAPQPAKIWQLLLVFFSGMLVGSVLSLGTLLAWRMYQERANIQIRLPADVPLPPSPSPVPTTPARLLPPIPPAPGTASPLPANIPSPIPSPNPTQVPSLSGLPQLASPLPQPSAAAGGQGGTAPTNSPSPAAETVIDRVNFAAGATGTTLSNTLPDSKSKRYLIDCRGGQTLTLNVPEGAVSATIIAPNGEKVGTANSTTPWEGQLPASGDYTIEISGESQANYGVKIEVK